MLFFFFLARVYSTTSFKRNNEHVHRQVNLISVSYIRPEIHQTRLLKSVSAFVVIWNSWGHATHPHQQQTRAAHA